MRTMTMTNTSGGLVEIVSLGLTGPAVADFTITSDSGESTLGVNDTRAVTVTYNPSLVGRSGAALMLTTDVDLHPSGVGLGGRGVDTAFVSPGRVFTLIGNHGVMEVPSQFGTNYSLARTTDVTNQTPPLLFTVPGNGQTLYLTDPDVLPAFTRAFYRVRAQRN